MPEVREATPEGDALVEHIAQVERAHFHGRGYTAAGHDADPATCQWCWESAEVAAEAVRPLLTSPARETTPD